MTAKAGKRESETGTDAANGGAVSERKRQANRENAKKSTGPKTARGKRNSSFNAMKHGLLAQTITIETDEDLDRLNYLVGDLYERYESEGDVRNELLLELAVVDYWRHARGLATEGLMFSPGLPRAGMANPGFSGNLFRYMTSNRHALIKTLDMLEEARNQRIRESQDADLAEDCAHISAREEELDVPPKKPPRRSSPGDRKNRSTPQAPVSPNMTQEEEAA